MPRNTGRSGDNPRIRCVPPRDVFVDHRANDILAEHLDLADFVRGAEAVEEMENEYGASSVAVWSYERDRAPLGTELNTTAVRTRLPRCHHIGGSPRWTACAASDRDETKQGTVRPQRYMLGNYRQTLRRSEGGRERNWSGGMEGPQEDHLDSTHPNICPKDTKEWNGIHGKSPHKEAQIISHRRRGLHRTIAVCLDLDFIEDDDRHFRSHGIRFEADVFVGIPW